MSTEEEPVQKSELRQRPGKGENKEEKDERRVEFIKAAGTSAPEAVRPYINKVAPAVVAAWGFGESMVPVAIQVKDKGEELWVLAQPYHPQDIFPALIGLAMVFFGGDFPVLIAAVTAFKETGVQQSMQRSFMEIYNEFNDVLAQSAKDDTVDDDGDGIPDVEQIPAAQVLQRKMMLAVKTVNPDKLADAITSVSAGALTIIASLKLTFARALSLGASLGATINKPVKRNLTPILEASIDKQYHRWIEPGINYTCKMLAMSFAFWLQRIISAIHSAIKGGQMFTTNTCRYLNKYKMIDFDPDQSNLDEQVGYAIGIIGIYYQMFYGTPIILSLVLMPLTLCEWALKFALSFA
eukprot:CAMPEP_0114340218 /NCGR_PEP_ID=MMETSP0101-20121206/8236_1 /TAXON_ID=38822 ORGANISM="Pteridomonas danica, Strain PT" /NCGR_SAMPLE_ID=MMETSP0101 /ASSEMBLY_ACC=CAM_ASM_000211 /LENGTH=351 /DNA_ID=CAMNT_0001473419 /DNA_START=61 /DNA_END=1116 /DNA_ORIENTATION=-